MLAFVAGAGLTVVLWPICQRLTMPGPWLRAPNRHENNLDRCVRNDVWKRDKSQELTRTLTHQRQLVMSSGTQKAGGYLSASFVITLQPWCGSRSRMHLMVARTLHCNLARD